MVLTLGRRPLSRPSWKDGPVATVSQKPPHALLERRLTARPSQQRTPPLVSLTSKRRRGVVASLKTTYVVAIFAPISMRLPEDPLARVKASHVVNMDIPPATNKRRPLSLPRLRPTSDTSTLGET